MLNLSPKIRLGMLITVMHIKNMYFITALYDDYLCFVRSYKQQINCDGVKESTEKCLGIEASEDSSKI